MNLPTTERKTHVILTIAGPEHFITEAQKSAIDKLDMNQSVRIDGCTIRLSAISQILTLDKYYEAFPEKYPEKPRATESLFPPDPRQYMTLEQLAERHEEHMSALLRGLKQYCDENPGAMKARALFEEKMKKFQLRKWQEERRAKASV